MDPILELVKCAMISSRMQRVEIQILPNDINTKNTIIIEIYIKLEFQSVVKYTIFKVQSSIQYLLFLPQVVLAWYASQSQLV